MVHFQPPRIPQAQPSAQFLSDAREVLANPEKYSERPLLRRLAWLTLKTANGMVCRQRHMVELRTEVAQ